MTDTSKPVSEAELKPITDAELAEWQTLAELGGRLQTDKFLRLIADLRRARDERDALRDAMHKVKVNAFSYFEGDSMRPSVFVDLIREIVRSALPSPPGQGGK